MIRGTREWAVAEINCCIGCPHACLYCYGRTSAMNRGLVHSAEEWSKSRIVAAAVEKEHPLYPGQVMFPAAHDITGENIEAAIAVIDNLLVAGNRVLIVSKPSPECINRLCERFREKREQILFRFTITARSEGILSFWEPGAPTYRQRLLALSLAHSRGFSTSVSVEPMLEIGDVAALVAELEPLVTHSIWIGKMNRIAERVTIDSVRVAEEVDRIEREQGDAEIRELYGLLQHHPLIRWKESIKEVVGLPLSEQAGLDR